jgi:phosphocarrier protein HPr
MRATVSKRLHSMRNSIAEASLEVRNASGLHIKPCELIGKTAIRFRSEITIARGNDVVDARNIVALTMLGAASGERLIIRAEGPDAEAAMAAIVALFESRFGEE